MSCWSGTQWSPSEGYETFMKDMLLTSSHLRSLSFCSSISLKKLTAAAE